LREAAKQEETAFTAEQAFAAIQSIIETVAKTVNYPMQDTTIHTIVGTQLWAVTIEGKQNQASQDSNRSCPNESGEHGNPSVATATPRLRQCMTQA
jgi:hypothetical protein